MWSHPLGVFITKTKWPYEFHLCLEPILFFSFVFSKPEHLITMASPPSPWSSLFAPSLGMCFPILMITRASRLAHRVSSIHQNQTRAFNLPLFGNWWQPLHKDMNRNQFWIHVACPSLLPCVKNMDKFYEPELVALAPPTYVLRVWIKACTYACVGDRILGYPKRWN